MGVFQNVSQGLILLLALPFLLAAGYVAVYAVLRCWGKLCVNADGWHAGSVQLGRRVVCSALRLFAAFQSPMRLESALARLFKAKRREQAVSEVVVEVIPLA